MKDRHVLLLSVVLAALAVSASTVVSAVIASRSAVVILTVTQTETLPVTRTETVTETFHLTRTVTETLTVLTVTVNYVQHECLTPKRVGEVYYFFERRTELKVVNICNRVFRNVVVIYVFEGGYTYADVIPVVKPYGEATVCAPLAVKITVVVPEE